ncbi:MAG: hypothetical protein JWN48_2935 [Myxococcaceae bacterium]|nr:hypothetical protein [Myxococcaceae bacterium]
MSRDATPEPMATSGQESSPRGSRRNPLTLILPLLPLVAIAAVWYFSDLRTLNSPEKLAVATRALRESPVAYPYVLLAFAAGTLLFFPVTALITGTVLAFPPLQGFVYAYSGTLLGACLTYWVGRLMGSRALDYASGPRMLKFGEVMRKHAIRASIGARILPIGNFTGLNLFAGSLRIPFASYFLGNLIGILPGVLFLTLFADQLSSVLRAPSWKNLSYLLAAVALAGLALWLYRRRGQSRVRAERRAERDAASASANGAASARDTGRNGGVA